ncbi:immune inhibitor A domain-containing protein [Sinorhizobium psoraleae]|uniref:immune inhibitor A domain-containing protein n=1 Tax=Sinorhizobium psoraleae TaxID=520838 RepID=UPI0035E3E8A2
MPRCPGKLLVQGQVHDWIRLSKNEEFYAGPSGCNGTCANARTGELLTEALRQADQAIDFTQFDNDGPDGMPNSGDDDGFVDFVAFVHPSLGGECAMPDNSSIWSHRWRISNWAGNNSFETNDSSVLGPRIRVDDYVIMPALACDKTTMIPIGVFFPRVRPRIWPSRSL